MIILLKIAQYMVILRDRFNSDLFVETVHSNFGQRSYKFGGSKFWNALPMSIKTKSSLFILKKEMKMNLMCKD